MAYEIDVKYGSNVFMNVANMSVLPSLKKGLKILKRFFCVTVMIYDRTMLLR